MPHTYDHPRPALTTDCVVFGLDGQQLKVLLIQRDRDPFAGRWAFPGGFVEMDEDLEQAARRELAEETGLRNISLEQLHTFGAVDRDPRERVVSVAYCALVNLCDHRAEAASDARNAEWHAVDDVPPLGFDHDRILQMARDRLQNKARHQPIGLDLLPPKFPLRQLQDLYEAVLTRPLDAQNFRTEMLSLGILQELDPIAPDARNPSEHLYSFETKKYDQMVSEGCHLEI